jgi:hypothetical protein
VQVHLEGFNGKTCPLVATVRAVDTGTPVFGFADLSVATFRPESEDEQASADVIVPSPSDLGHYYVEFEIRDNDGVTILDSAISTTYYVRVA